MATAVRAQRGDRTPCRRPIILRLGYRLAVLSRDFSILNLNNPSVPSSFPAYSRSLGLIALPLAQDIINSSPTRGILLLHNLDPKPDCKQRVNRSIIGLQIVYAMRVTLHGPH